MCNTWLNVKPCDSCFFNSPLDQSFFSIIIVTWKKFVFRVQIQLFFFSENVAIFSISQNLEKKKKKHPALDHYSLHIHHIFFCFLGVWVYACIIMVEFTLLCIYVLATQMPMTCCCVLHSLLTQIPANLTNHR
jgi:hypothetical protein